MRLSTDGPLRWSHRVDDHFLQPEQSARIQPDNGDVQLEPIAKTRSEFCMVGFAGRSLYAGFANIDIKS
jgi:hypothetical protein